MTDDERNRLVYTQDEVDDLISFAYDCGFKDGRESYAQCEPVSLEGVWD